MWLTDFYHKGENAFPLLDRWIETQSSTYFEKCHSSDSMGPVAIDLYKRFGVFPIGDTCTPGGGSWPYWYHSGEAVEKNWKEDPEGWWQWYFQHMTDHVAEIRKITEDPTQRVSDYFPAKKSGEVMIDMVEAIACDIPRVLIGNIPNRGGFVPGVPEDIAVEIPLLCSARGIQGVQTKGLPSGATAYLLRDRVAPVNLELEAFTAGSLDALLELILTDPYTKSLEQAQALLTDILELKPHTDMKAHYC